MWHRGCLDLDLSLLFLVSIARLVVLSTCLFLVLCILLLFVIFGRWLLLSL